MNDPIGEKLDAIIEKGKQREQEQIERELYEKAVKRDKDNMNYLNRAFPYINEEHLYESIRSLYPEINELFLVDLDQRDSNNVPLIKTKNFRSLKVSHVKTTYKGGYYSGKSDCSVDVQFRMIIAVIENGQVYIKSAKLSNGYYNRSFH